MKRNYLFFIFRVFMTSMVSHAAFGSILYVDDDSPGGNGLSWQTAYQFLQDGLAVAQAGDEIRVAQGVYKPDCDTATPEGSGEREVSFVLADGLTLKGGYAGLTGFDPNAWDVDLYETILSGDLAGNDVLAEDPCDFVARPGEDYPSRPTQWCLLIESTRAENCFHVVDASAVGETTTLEGFTISGGQAHDPPYYLAHIQFERNDYGAGVLNEGGNLCLRQCVIKENAAMAMGPGIQNQGGTLQVFDCNVIHNEAHYGRQCMWIEDSQVEMEGCRFQGSMDYGFAFNFSDWIWSGDSILSVTNCEFINHSNRRDCYSGIGLYNGEASFKKCRFSGHTSGVIHVSGSDLNVEQCEFIGNRGGDGVAIKLDSGNIVNIAESIFIANNGGSAVCSISSTILNANITNCVFAGNCSVYRGGGLQCGINTKVSNCIFWGNRAPLGADIFAYKSRVCFNFFEFPQSVEFYDVTLTEDSLDCHNVFGDPCFVDPGCWDVNSTPDELTDDSFIPGDYHLKSKAGHWDSISDSWICDESTSPCIDAGDPNSPIMYEPFPNGGRINMGAYGGTSEASKSYFGCSPCEVIIAGDINGDCEVNYLDLAVLASHWTE